MSGAKVTITFGGISRASENLVEKWENLVRRINAKGGEEFLQKGVILSDEEIKALIKFCHPDKHGGSLEANEITKRLLGIRAQRK